MILLLLCFLLLAAVSAGLVVRAKLFERDRDTIPYRIHVNGIRGKSTVTRYTAAILREAGLRTYAKTTGTAARVILPDGQDALIERRGSANVNEQVRILRSFAARRAEAAVLECMAINPDYQDWLENKVMHSHIVIITNVRIDHQEEMGMELADIARSLARSIPAKALVITAEQRPELIAVLRKAAKARGSRLVVASSQAVSDADVARFSHVAHKENIAIGLAIAKLFRVPAKRALTAMAAAPADPGAFQVQTFKQHNKHIAWANLFAVNDKESFAQIAQDLAEKYPDHYRIALLNNRHDRPSRVELFSHLAQDALNANAVVALGDYEDRVRKSVNKPDTKVALLGNTSQHSNSSGRELLDSIVQLADKPRVLLIGTVNIHTRQSEHILEHVAKITGEAVPQALATYKPQQRISRNLLGIIDRLDREVSIRKAARSAP